MLLTLAGMAWMLATPLVTGPDEVFQARRAAAVVRGELMGEATEQSPILVDVTVPTSYLEAGEYGFCFTGQPVAGAPVGNMPPREASCPEFGDDATPAAAETGQYRGQPFFYAVVGLPTLVDTGALGAYGVRLIGVLITTALLASAAVSVLQAARRRMAALALFGCVTPMVLYLAASTNPSSVEIAAALAAWASGVLLARPGTSPTTREVTRFGVAVIVLILARGLGPMFAAGIIATLAVLAGWGHTRALLRRHDVQVAAAAAAIATVASGAWLWSIQRSFPLPERPGSGVATAIGQMPLYIHQSVGVFGQNDSALPQPAAWLWAATLMAVLCVGLWRCSTKAAALSVAVLGAGLALSITAEGLSLPPIGFFWQGRYALPVLLGAFLLATCTRPVNRPDPWGPPEADGAGTGARADPWNVAALLADRRTPGLATGLALGLFLTVHASAFLAVARHHGARGGDPQSWWRLFTAARWSPPLTFPLLLALYLVALGMLAWHVVRLDTARPHHDG
ncbi:MAG: DUF2142 domain-containing protein [Microthrixaceae bacterium]|nr:DUF2142 domain-containing protein [Microthrixaceae bacterium]